jgi:moderate conductance mechanosensitive channel
MPPVRAATDAPTPTPSPAPTGPDLPVLGDLQPDSWVDRLVGTPLVIATVVLVALVVRWLWFRVVNSAVERVDRLGGSHERAGESRMNAALGEIVPAERRRQRAEAVGALLRSLGTATVTIVAALIILTRLGINVGPLIAGAGIVGIAFGFGAQSLVKDFISGVFMVFEDQYGVGDVVDTGSVVGTVEDVGLRITRVRDLNGVVWYIRNGEIVNLGNRSQGWSFVAVDMPVALDEDLDRVRTVVDEVGAAMIEDRAWTERLLDPPSLVGVEAVTGFGVTVRITTRAAAQQQLPVARELRERLKAAFDAAGIVVPVAPPGFGQTRDPR